MKYRIMEKCKTPSCQNQIHANTGFMALLGKNLFGPYGNKLVEGHCKSCGERNLWKGWLALLAIITFLITIVGLPDFKPGSIALLIFAFWYGLYKVSTKTPARTE